MRIPKVISKNNHEYIFEKQINDRLFLYKNSEYGYRECFSLHDLGLIKNTRKEREGQPREY